MKRKYYELYANEFDNFDDNVMSKIPKLTKGEIDNLISPITKIFPQRRLQAQMASLVNSTKNLQKLLYQFYTNSSRK